MPDDFSIEQVDQYTNVMPLVSNLHIGQITDNEAFSLRLLKLAIEDIGRPCFVTVRLMRLILSDGIGGNKSLLLHDAPNATSGGD